MSAEVDADVADAYLSIRTPLEETVNALLSSRNYGGSAIDEWAAIPMITTRTATGYSEIARLSRDRRTAEFRLRVSHSDFATANPVGQQRLIVDMLVRCVLRMGSLGIEGLDAVRLVNDLNDLSSLKP